ncbi:MAG TPA: asparaginase [Streptosporangiaceae bacterium]|nr:asparaginase [Streptosporangiaceae bacterium]
MLRARSPARRNDGQKELLMNQPGKPVVCVFTLGGTIAMKPADAGGVVPTLSAADLIAAIPGLGAEPLELAVHDVANKPGASLSFTEIYDLADDITAAPADRCAGAVVVQGTDTIEETAYLLDLLIASDSPVVVTGAMRNPSLAGADGPANLLASIRVAASQTARGLGTLVVLNDQIHAARWVAKTHTASTAAFTSPGFGPLGQVIEGRVDIPVRLRHRSPVLRPDRQREVIVGLTTVTLGDDGSLIEAASEMLDGVVVAALGVGHVPADIVPVLAKAAANVPVVLSSRIGAGPVHQQTYSFTGSETDLLSRGLISAGYLAPVKARLLLHLLIASGADIASIAETFQLAGGIPQDRA